ncbi:hypothetical protein N7520_000167 [Penicillium odoratum]|uniref:uncharacterized protein n=1 Tax=Penicillium odoratum TaxID=1167516 RepID=UPI0025487F52|nr:uncharacterized protein N7520_000167 [Penicillium odoratum]KAJ5776921.1 hypothetical protein N7520_000167 [Penicillium odoratum]
MILAPGNKEERHYVYTFFTQASASLAGSIPSDLWARLIPQLSHHKPMVRHAVAAVSAAYVQQTQPSAISRNSRFIIQQYNKAIQDFIHLASRQGEDLELLLTTCILFICLEMIRGNQGQAVSHTESALRIFKSYLERTSSTSGLDRELSQLLVRMNIQLPYMGRPLILQDEPMKPVYDKKLPFESFHQARQMIAKLNRRTLKFNESMRLDENGELIDEDQRQEYKALLQESKDWRVAFQKMIADSKTRIPDPRAPLVLEIGWHASVAWVKCCTRKEECAYDDLNDHWEGMVHSAEEILRLTDSEHDSALSGLFSIDSEIVPMMYWTATKCRDPWIRRRAISVLSRHPRREGFYNVRMYRKVAERVLELEEAPLASLSIGQRVPLEEHRFSLVHISPTDGVYKNPVPVFYMMRSLGLGHAPVTWWEDVDW